MAKSKYSKTLAPNKEPFRLWYEFLKQALFSDTSRRQWTDQPYIHPNAGCQFMAKMVMWLSRQRDFAKKTRAHCENLFHGVRHVISGKVYYWVSERLSLALMTTQPTMKVNAMPLAITARIKVSVKKALEIRDHGGVITDSRLLFKCVECGRTVRPYERSQKQKAHFEHLSRNPKCSLSHKIQKKLKSK